VLLFQVALLLKVSKVVPYSGRAQIGEAVPLQALAPYRPSCGEIEVDKAFQYLQAPLFAILRTR
jgi:hypothetical protein